MKHLRLKQKTIQGIYGEADRRGEHSVLFLAESFGAAGRHYPGTEEENVEL